MEIVQILQSVSVIFACLSIVLGVDAWRREYVGKRKIELAEDVLTLFYQARDAVRRIRRPWSNSSEGQNRKPTEHETPEEKNTLDRAYVAFERFEKEREIFTKIDVLRYRFMARFGQNTSKPFDDLRATVNDILFSAEILGTHYWQRQGRVKMTPEEFQNHLKEMHEHEANFWEGFSKEDPIKKRLEEAIKDLEKICRPIIEEQSGVASFLVKKLFKKK
ncbi:MAG TPA: hypothetical protein VHY30_11520 [Verrucomicrobiae bacterium]|jgi:hypothetical protein|nr:hypothetical protein [Verrucomicrobiae bacterium]